MDHLCSNHFSTLGVYHACFNRGNRETHHQVSLKANLVKQCSTRIHFLDNFLAKYFKSKAIITLRRKARLGAQHTKQSLHQPDGSSGSPLYKYLSDVWKNLATTHWYATLHVVCTWVCACTWVIEPLSLKCANCKIGKIKANINTSHNPLASAHPSVAKVSLCAYVYHNKTLHHTQTTQSATCFRIY